MKISTLCLLVMLALTNTAMAQISDPSFEAGPGGNDWSEASTNFDTPVCDLASCGDCGGPCQARTGDFYVWFGGAGAAEVGSVGQTVVIPTGSEATLSMFLKIPDVSNVDGDRMEVRVDGDTLATIVSADSDDYAEYAALDVDVSAYADSASHEIIIEGFVTSATIINFLIDDVSLTVDGVTTGLFERELNEDAVFVYPNPVGDMINLEFRKIEGAAHVILRAMNGAIVSQENIHAVMRSTYTCNTQALVAGIYTVEVLTASSKSVQRFVVK